MFLALVFFLGQPLQAADNSDGTPVKTKKTVLKSTRKKKSSTTARVQEEQDQTLPRPRRKGKRPSLPKEEKRSLQTSDRQNRW